MDENKTVRCNACGCAFEPKALTEKDGDIEYTFFHCDFCGKAYMVSVTDSELRKSIAVYVRRALQNRKARLSERRQRRMQELKAYNVQKERELRSRYLQEDADAGE